MFAFNLDLNAICDLTYRPAYDVATHRDGVLSALMDGGFDLHLDICRDELGRYSLVVTDTLAGNGKRFEEAEIDDCFRKHLDGIRERLAAEKAEASKRVTSPVLEEVIV